MNITRVPSPVSKRGSANWFSGAVWIDEIAAGPNSSNVRVARVSFEPGARTAWHAHPAGQLLHIVAGVGRVQKSGEPPIEVHPGDTIWFEPGERHWHGATPTRSLVHLAVQQTDADGAPAHWFEHVSDAEYHGPTA